MDTIRSYLDNMFLALPNNEKTKRAKEELLSMMEDKYLELKASGKTENEAVGIVISEFGNLEEVSEALGLGEAQLDDDTGIKFVSLDEAKSYIEDVREYFPKVALGIGLIISSISILMFMLGAYSLNIIGLSEDRTSMLALLIMFFIVAIGVYFIVANNMQLSKYKYLEEKDIHLDYQTKEEVRKIKDQVSTRFNKALSFSVMLYILSVVPVFISLVLFGEDNDGSILISVGFLILIVAFATYNLLIAHGPYNAANKLLREGEYKNYNSIDHEKVDRIGSIYWSIVVALYLAYSFITDDWGRSWIIWPVAAVLFGGISAFFNM